MALVKLTAFNPLPYLQRLLVHILHTKVDSDCLILKLPVNAAALHDAMRANMSKTTSAYPPHAYQGP